MSKYLERKPGRIYKIVNSETDDIYVGSTFQTLKARFKAHRSLANRGESNIPLYVYMREHMIDKFSIELLEEFDSISMKELGEKELEYYEKLKPVLNSRPPQVKVDKTHGFIYKLFEISDEKMFYVGSSTTTLTQRFSCHKSSARTGSTPIHVYMREVGVENFGIELVEDNIPISELITRENYWLQTLDPLLNKNKFLCRTEQERDAAKYAKNQEKIKARVNSRRIQNRDKINEQKREHYALNKDKILAYQRTEEYKIKTNAKRRERRLRKKLEGQEPS